jgi:thioredoxin-related protein
MKRILIAVAVLAAVWQVKAADAVWWTDLPKAEAQAKAEHKRVLLDFTGSDWCPACIQLKKIVFVSPQFQNYAATNLVLVAVDFPRRTPQPDELKKRNAKLQDRFKVEALPTLVVLDASGKEIGRQVGYAGDDPGDFIAALDKFQAGGK